MILTKRGCISSMQIIRTEHVQNYMRDSTETSRIDAIYHHAEYCNDDNNSAVTCYFLL